MKELENNKIIYDKDGNKVGEISVNDAVEDLIYDDDGNEIDTTATDIVEELSEEETETIVGGVTYSYKGTKYRTITLKRKGGFRTFAGDSPYITRGSSLVKTSGSGPYVTITRKSASKGTATVVYHESHGWALSRSHYYYKYIVTVKCT